MDELISSGVFRVLKELDKVKVNRMLDVGCNNGDTSIKVADFVKCNDLFGVDIDETAIQKAKEKNVKAFKVNLDSDRLPFPDGAFDLVIMTEVIEHLVNGDAALQEASRVLSANGYFLLTSPNLSWYVNRLVLLFGYQPYWTGCGKYNVGKFRRSINEDSSGHLRLFTARALVELLELNGFRILKLKGASISKANGIFRSIDKTIARLRWSLAQDVVVVAQKNLPE